MFFGLKKTVRNPSKATPTHSGPIDLRIRTFSARPLVSGTAVVGLGQRAHSIKGIFIWMKRNLSYLPNSYWEGGYQPQTQCHVIDTTQSSCALDFEAGCTWVTQGSILNISRKEIVPTGTRLVHASIRSPSVSERVLGHSSVTRQPVGRSDRLISLTRASSRRALHPGWFCVLRES